MNLHDLLRQKKECEKIIGISKYERVNPETAQWWWKKFKNMEEFSRLPFHKRMKFLEKCFSKDTLQDIIDSNVEVHQEINTDLDDVEGTYCLVPRPSRSKLAPIREPPTEPKKRKQYSNVYLNFMRKTEEKARVWQPRKRPSIDKMHIIKKAKNIEEMIAAEFDEWFQTVGSTVDSEINKETIVSLFQLLFHFPASTSLIRKIQEVGSVPKYTAKYMGLPQCSDERCVVRHLLHDIKAERLGKFELAFNKLLPEELRSKPLEGNLKAKWFSYQAKRADLVNMAYVWRGITQLYSTNAFCFWLLEHPEVKPPQYLVDIGMMNKKFLTDNATTVVGPDELEKLLAIAETTIKNLKSQIVVADA